MNPPAIPFVIPFCDGENGETKLDFWDIVTRTLAARRLVIIHGEIEEDSTEDTTRELLFLAHVSQEPIRVILNSVGGDVFDGLLVFDTIRSIAAQGIEVTVEARGLAASMGALILQAASPGKRIASKHTRILIHEVSSMSAGRTSEQEDQVRELKKLNDMLRDIIAQRTGKPASEIEKLWHKTDVWYSAQEALDFGLIDEVV